MEICSPLSSIFVGAATVLDVVVDLDDVDDGVDDVDDNDDDTGVSLLSSSNIVSLYVGTPFLDPCHLV